ncbi:MAG: hypothetical protein ACJ76L_10570 [Conexibacter sp.]
MNPSFMWVQAVCLALACAILGLTPCHLEAIIVALMLTVVWLVMNATYAHALEGRRRSAGEDGGPNRQRQDRRVRRQAVFAVVVGFAAGIAGSRLPDLWLWHDRQLLSVCFGALGALAWTVYASSLVDWYCIRPRLDGIVRRPPCCSSGDETWGDVTRLWYFHRGVAEFLGIVAVIVAFSAFVGALIAGTGSLPTAAAVALPTGAAGALVLLTQTAISTLRHRVINRPWIWIGDELRDGGRRGYVLHLTARGVFVSTWDAERGGWGREREITHERIDAEGIEPGRFSGCERYGRARCAKVNPACEWEETDHAATLPRRWLVW